jgi:hypothetical protein
MCGISQFHSLPVVRGVLFMANFTSQCTLIWRTPWMESAVSNLPIILYYCPKSCILYDAIRGTFFVFFWFF